MAKSLDIIDPKKELGNNSSQDEEREEKVLRASEPEEKSGGVFYLVIGIIAVIVSASLALYILFKDNKSADNSAAKASVTATADTSVSPTASTTASVATTATSTSPVAATSTSSSTFTYTNEQIRIANGNSIAGEASRIKTLLEAKGLKIASVGNASKQYDASFVYYKTGQEKLAAAIKTALAGEYNATIENSDTTVGTYDAVVVLGAK